MEKSKKLKSNTSPDIGVRVRVYTYTPGDLGSNPRSRHTKDSKNGT